MTLTEILSKHYPAALKGERKNAIATVVSKEIRANLPKMEFKKVKECQWEVIDYPDELIYVLRDIIDNCIAEGM